MENSTPEPPSLINATTVSTTMKSTSTTSTAAILHQQHQDDSSKDSTESTTASSSQHHGHHGHHHGHKHHHHHHHHHHRHSSRSSNRCSSSESAPVITGGSGGTSISPSIIRTNTGWFQRKINLRPVNRGCHLITDELVKQLPEMTQFQIGICNFHILHTSASLTLNENWDPDVREDMEMFLLQFVPENLPFRHVCEGPDDMPAHVKSSFIGSSLNIPITDGKLNLGTWQGIWLCEHRNNAGSRKVMVTINGALKNV